VVLLVRYQLSHELFVCHIFGKLRDRRGWVQRFVRFGTSAGRRIWTPQLGIDRDHRTYTRHAQYNMR